MIISYRRQQEGGHHSIHTGDAEVDRVSSFKFLGVQITEDLSWSPHTDTVVKKARQQLYFLRRLRKFGMNACILTNFYKCTTESLLAGYITVWYGNCSAHSHKSLQRVVEAAQYIIGNRLPAIQDISHQWCLWKARSINKYVADCSPCYHLAGETGV